MADQRLYIILQFLTHAGYVDWVTEDLSDQDAGCSGAGHASREAALENALQGHNPARYMIADLTDLGDDAINRTQAQFAQLVRERAVKAEDYLEK